MSWDLCTVLHVCLAHSICYTSLVRHIFLTLPSNSCSEMFFTYTSLWEKQMGVIQTMLISHGGLKHQCGALAYPDTPRCDFVTTLCALWENKWQRLNWLFWNRSFLSPKGLFILRAAGWPDSARSPDGFLPLLWIRGHVGLHLVGRPLYLHLNDLWRKKTLLRLYCRSACWGAGHMQNAAPSCLRLCSSLVGNHSFLLACKTVIKWVTHPLCLMASYLLFQLFFKYLPLTWSWCNDIGFPPVPSALSMFSPPGNEKQKLRHKYVLDKQTCELLNIYITVPAPV